MTEREAIRASVDRWKENREKAKKNMFFFAGHKLCPLCIFLKVEGFLDTNKCQMCPFVKYTGARCVYGVYGEWSQSTTKKEKLAAIDKMIALMESWLKESK